VPVCVEAPAGEASSFSRSFHEFLVTRLVQGGAKVVSQPADDGVRLSYDTQVVRHHSARPPLVPGEATVLAAGLQVVRWDMAKQLNRIAVVGVADLVGSTLSSSTSTELILSTSVMRGAQYLSRKTDVYYLEDVDASLFERAPRSGEMKVVGP